MWPRGGLEVAARSESVDANSATPDLEIARGARITEQTRPQCGLKIGQKVGTNRALELKEARGTHTPKKQILTKKIIAGV